MLFPHLRLPAGRFALLAPLAVLVALALVAISPHTRVALADGGAPNLAYISCGGSSGQLVIVDISQRHVTGRVALGGDPAGVVLDPTGQFAYVTERTANRVAVVDTRGKQVAATISAGNQPGALVLQVVGGTTELYVADATGNTVTVLDAGARRVLATIPVGRQPSGIAAAGPDSGISDPNDAEIYVANSGDNTVSVISATQRRVVATIPVADGPLGVVVPATGGVAYVSTRAGAIVALGLADHRVLGTVLRLPGSQLGAMDYDAVTGQIYVPDAASGMVAVLAPASVNTSEGTPPVIPHEPARMLPVGGSPAAVAITFDGAYGFVAEHGGSRVAMLDAGTQKPLAAIPLGCAPAAIITGPYPPVVSGLTGLIITILFVAFLAVLFGSLVITDVRTRARRHGGESQNSDAKINQESELI